MPNIEQLKITALEKITFLKDNLAAGAAEVALRDEITAAEIFLQEMKDKLDPSDTEIYQQMKSQLDEVTAQVNTRFFVAMAGMQKNIQRLT